MSDLENTFLLFQALAPSFGIYENRLSRTTILEEGGGAKPSFVRGGKVFLPTLEPRGRGGSNKAGRCVVVPGVLPPPENISRNRGIWEERRCVNLGRANLEEGGGAEPSFA